MRTDSLTISLAVLVVVHFLITVMHGVAHSVAHVPLTPIARVFVIVVILFAPLVGLALIRVQPRAGAALVSASMAGALLFGIVNHFALSGSDHVSQVEPQWRLLFGSTAVLVALTEAGATIVGAMAALRYARRQS
jgi:hypothetical protein